jgi:hypothetical protein
MRVFSPSPRPEPWASRRKRVEHSWVLPFVKLERGWEWLAYFLSHWKFLEVLEYMSSLSILFAVLVSARNQFGECAPLARKF